MWTAYAKAMFVLLLKLPDRMRATLLTNLLQVGTGSRSEKIKTYNFKDSRVSQVPATSQIYNFVGLDSI